jgi:hypothetical protein
VETPTRRGERSGFQDAMRHHSRSSSCIRPRIHTTSPHICHASVSEASAFRTKNKQMLRLRLIYDKITQKSIFEVAQTCRVPGGHRESASITSAAFSPIM